MRTSLNIRKTKKVITVAALVHPGRIMYSHPINRFVWIIKIKLS